MATWQTLSAGGNCAFVGRELADQVCANVLLG